MPVCFWLDTALRNINFGNPNNQSSTGAGIYITDSGYAYSGYIRVSNNGYQNKDRTAYIIKAPGSTNVLHFDVSSMVIDNTTKNENVVMKLKSSSYSDSSYSMVASSLDISNIFIKDIARSDDLKNNTQKVSTNIGISGNLFINKDFTGISNTALDVSGNVIMSKLGIGTPTVNSNYYLEVSGNMTQNNGWIHQF